jgi:hypothetical protein
VALQKVSPVYAIYLKLLTPVLLAEILAEIANTSLFPASSALAISTFNIVLMTSGRRLKPLEQPPFLMEVLWLIPTISGVCMRAAGLGTLLALIFKGLECSSAVSLGYTDKIYK